MKRLTRDKPAKNMSMVELAHNNCYVADHQARYRDYDGDYDARDFIRKVAKNIGVEIIAEDDEALDELLYDWLEDGYSSSQGILAWMYCMLWSKAELYETLKMYEERNCES